MREDGQRDMNPRGILCVWHVDIQTNVELRSEKLHDTMNRGFKGKRAPASNDKGPLPSNCVLCPIGAANFAHLCVCDKEVGVFLALALRGLAAILEGELDGFYRLALL